MSGKQCRPWSDAAFCSIWSGSTLFAKACLSQYGIYFNHYLSENIRLDISCELSARWFSSSSWFTWNVKPHFFWEKKKQQQQTTCISKCRLLQLWLVLNPCPAENNKLPVFQNVICCSCDWCLTLVLLNKLRCHSWFSANQITWSRLSMI